MTNNSMAAWVGKYYPKTAEFDNTGGTLPTGIAAEAPNTGSAPSITRWVEKYTPRVTTPSVTLPAATPKPSAQDILMAPTKTNAARSVMSNIYTPSHLTQAVQEQYEQWTIGLEQAGDAESEAWDDYNRYNNSTHWSEVDYDKLEELANNTAAASQAKQALEKRLQQVKYGNEYAEKYGVGSGLQGFDKGVISIGKTIGATPGVVAQTTKAAWEEGTAENADPEVLAAREKEAAVQRAVDSYMAAYMGFLDLPEQAAELERLNEELAAATAERKTAESKHIVPLDMNTKAMRNMQTAGFLKDDATANLSGFGRDAADAALSVGQNLPFVAVSFIPVVGKGLAAAGMSAAAAAQDMYEQGAEGKNAGAAFQHGAAVGAIEGLTEKIPLDNLADMVKTGGKNFVVNILKQAGIEAAEEGVSYTMNYILDKAEGDPNAKFDWNEFGQSVKIGGLSGMFFGLGGTTANVVRTHARDILTGEALTQNLTTQARPGIRPHTETLPGANPQQFTLPVDENRQKKAAPAQAETEDYYFDEAENNTSWRDRMYTENGKTYIQSQDRQRMYEVPSQDEIKYEVRDDGAVVLSEDVLSNLSPRDYRDFAKAYAELNLVTKYAADRVTISEAKPVTVNSTGKDIIITQTGISEYAKKLRGKGIKNRDNVSSVLLLNKLIENAKPISAADNTHSETGNPFTYYKSKFEVGDRTYDVTLHIKNVPSGDHYYYHALDKVDIEAETQKNVVSTYGSPVQDGEYPNEMETTIPDTTLPQVEQGVKNQYTQGNGAVFMQGSVGNEGAAAAAQAGMLPGANPQQFTLPLGENGQNKTGSASAETEQITSERNLERYQAAIDGAFTGALPSGRDIVIGQTPAILQKYGAGNHELHMDQNTAMKIAYPTGYLGIRQGHNLGMSALKNLPAQLVDPAAILNNPQPNSKKANSIIVLTEWENKQGQSVIIPLHLNVNGAVSLENKVASAFGAEEDYLASMLGESNSNVLYTKNNEDIRQLLSNRRPMPEAMADDILAKNSIYPNHPGVKNEDARKAGAQTNAGGVRHSFDGVGVPGNTASGTETTQQITSESNMQRYRSAIDGVFTGALPSGSDIVIGSTPSVLQRYGAPDLNLRVSQNTVRKIVYPEGYMGGKHNLGMSAMKNLPYQIADPVAILKSKSQPNSLVLLTEWKTQDGQDVIVPIHLNKQGAVEAGNAVASAYGKGDVEALLGVNDSNVLYTKNNEDIRQLLSNGLQLPEAMADDILAKNSIYPNHPGVNGPFSFPGRSHSGMLPVDESLAVKHAADTAASGILPGANPQQFTLPVGENGKKKVTPANIEPVNENGLTSYSEQEITNLSSGKKNKIVSTFSDALIFVRKALSNNQTSEKAYFGKITGTVAQKAMNEASVDISNYNAILQSDNARHIVKQHGNAMTEAARGQIPVTAEDIALIPEILSSPDSIRVSPDLDSRGRRVLIFEKQMNDNYVTMQAVSDGRYALQTDTLYIQKRKNSQGTGYNASGITDPAHNARSVPPQSSF